MVSMVSTVSMLSIGPRMRRRCGSEVRYVDLDVAEALVERVSGDSQFPRRRGDVAACCDDGVSKVVRWNSFAGAHGGDPR
jgi:hypothetical protein